MYLSITISAICFSVRIFIFPTYDAGLARQQFLATKTFRTYVTCKPTNQIAVKIKKRKRKNSPLVCADSVTEEESELASHRGFHVSLKRYKIATFLYRFRCHRWSQVQFNAINSRCLYQNVNGKPVWLGFTYVFVVTGKSKLIRLTLPSSSQLGSFM